MSFVKKYAPKTLNDVVLEQSIKSTLDSYILGGNETPLILHGTNGLGKTSIAALLPSAMEGGIVIHPLNGPTDTFNTVDDVISFFGNKYAFSLCTFSGGNRDYFVLDEVYFKKNVVFEFRKYMEKYQNVVQFIFTTNSYMKIDKGIRDRCIDIELKPANAQDWLSRVQQILQAENVTISNSTVMNVITAQLAIDSSNRQLLNKIEALVWQYKTKSKVNSITGISPFSPVAPITVTAPKLRPINTISTAAPVVPFTQSSSKK
jgi:replication-associated recombination protein RarA